MPEALDVLEGTRYQGKNESCAYKITTTPWGSVPTSPSATAFDTTSGVEQNVTTTVFPTNTPTVAGDIITLSVLTALAVSHIYRIEVKFTIGVNIFSCYFTVRCV